MFLISNTSEKNGKGKEQTERLKQIKKQRQTIPKVLIDSGISHEEFTLVINEEQNYFRLKESIRSKDDQLSDIERDRLIEHG